MGWPSLSVCSTKRFPRRATAVNFAPPAGAIRSPAGGINRSRAVKQGIGQLEIGLRARRQLEQLALVGIVIEVVAQLVANSSCCSISGQQRHPASSSPACLLKALCSGDHPANARASVSQMKLHRRQEIQYSRQCTKTCGRRRLPTAVLPYRVLCAAPIPGRLKEIVKPLAFSDKASSSGASTSRHPSGRPLSMEQLPTTG